MGWLQASYPALITRYEQMYARSAYGPKQDRNALGKTVGKLIVAAGGIKPRAHIAARFARERHTREAAKPKQLTLI